MRLGIPQSMEWLLRSLMAEAIHYILHQKYHTRVCISATKRNFFLHLFGNTLGLHYLCRHQAMKETQDDSEYEEVEN